MGIWWAACLTRVATLFNKLCATWRDTQRVDSCIIRAVTALRALGHRTDVAN